MCPRNKKCGRWFCRCSIIWFKYNINININIKRTLYIAYMYLTSCTSLSLKQFRRLIQQSMFLYNDSLIHITRQILRFIESVQSRTPCKKISQLCLHQKFHFNALACFLKGYFLHTQLEAKYSMHKMWRYLYNVNICRHLYEFNTSIQVDGQQVVS